MNCKPSETICTGDQIIPCQCTCDNCEAHDMECQGCVNCDTEADKAHVWIDALDPRWMICLLHDSEAMVKAA